MNVNYSSIDKLDNILKAQKKKFKGSKKKLNRNCSFSQKRLMQSPTEDDITFDKIEVNDNMGFIEVSYTKTAGTPQYKENNYNFNSELNKKK